MARSKETTPGQINSDIPIDQTMLDHMTPKTSPDVQGAQIDSETVLLELSTGRYYTLNSLGSTIWEHCTGHKTISDIHALLCDRFEVDSEQAQHDLVAFINHMVQEGLLLLERK